MIWLIDLDHNLDVYGNIFPVYKASGPQPNVQSSNFEDESFVGTAFKKAFVYEYLKPVYQSVVMTVLDLIGSQASTFEQNNEDGAYTILDHKVEDYLPLKK